MAAKILDGKKLAQHFEQQIAADVEAFTQETGVQPCLAVVLTGDDPASQVYVRSKQKACGRVGIESRLVTPSADASTDELLAAVSGLNNDAGVHGILVQVPLPEQIDESRVLEAVSPIKDVDAFHPENVGRIVQGKPRFLPCTPQGIQRMLIHEEVPTAGKHAVVVGRSDIVGKPMANMLMQRGPGGDATVTVCHSKTPDLASVTRQADLLVVAIGRPKFITAEMVKPGAVVVDVGINRTEEGLVGDVDFGSVSEVAGLITPVPGGVGRLTVVMVLQNALAAARMQV